MIEKSPLQNRIDSKIHSRNITYHFLLDQGSKQLFVQKLLVLQIEKRLNSCTHFFSYQINLIHVYLMVIRMYLICI